MKRNGFTLIELSIVLVIISLIIGGVVGGKSLLETARINKQIAQLIEIKTAVHAFELEYDALPGDFDEAEEYWQGGVTESGNGNGIIQHDGGVNLDMTDPTDAGYVNASYDDDFAGEFLHFFVHLSLAGILPGNYTNTTDPTNSSFAMPLMKLNPAARLMVGGMLNSSGETTPDINGLTHLTDVNIHLKVCDLSELPHVGRSDNGCGVMNARHALRIDRKIDDGSPLAGQFLSYRARASGTNTWPDYGDQTCVINSRYNVGIRDSFCNAIYKLE